MLGAIEQARAEQAQQAALGAQYAGLGTTLSGQQRALDAARQQQALQALTAGQGLLGGGLGLQQLQQQLGTTALGASYLPQTQLLRAFAPGQTAAAQQQQAQMYGAGLFGEATASGIDALLGAEVGRGNIIGAAGTGLLKGLVAPNGILEGLI
jgi:rare lipoprotein A (peptidoglycan hydrolase)